MKRDNKTAPSPFQGEGWGEGSHPRNLKLVPIAKRLRRQLTEVEKKLWYYLRGRRFEDVKFRRQYPIGKYVVDFICVEKQLIIELDGGQHEINPQRDRSRDAWLHRQGYRIMRFWNSEVTGNLQGVLESILSILTNPHPNPLPERERGKESERRDV